MGTRWSSIYADDRTKLYDVGTNRDGTLYNPNGYPEDVVRAVVQREEERGHKRRSDAAKKAAVTRRRRQEKKIYETVLRLLDGCPVGPRMSCACCGRGLADTVSIERGIGSECWQDVLTRLELERPTPEEARQHYRARRAEVLGDCRRTRQYLATQRQYLSPQMIARLRDGLKDNQQRLASLRRQFPATHAEVPPASATVQMALPL